MSSRDIRNNVLVHGILVRNYLNVRRLDSAVTGETVTIRGLVELAREAESVNLAVRRAVTLRTLDKAEEEIKKIPDINYVKWNLDNWIRVGRRWVEAESPTASRKESGAARPVVSKRIESIREKLRERQRTSKPHAGTEKRPSE